MIVVSAFFLPVYYRLNVYTAYEYVERRFDVRVRYLGASLFLVQRGLAAGLTIYAPAIVLNHLDDALTLIVMPVRSLRSRRRPREA